MASFPSFSACPAAVKPGDTLAGGDGGDRYTGLDRFGRVIDQNHVNTSTGVSTDRFQFAYDRNSNALYENNLLNSSFSELFHANSSASGDDATAYDGLNRIVGFERGTLSASSNNGTTLDTVSSPTGFFATQSWNYDSLGNITSDTGARYGSETRTANSQNELTQVKGTATLNPTYDSNGNMIGDGLGNTFVYDAWNRPVTAKQNGSVVYSYGYMANLNMGASTDTNNFTTTDFYYSADGHEIEDRQGNAITAQYVWGLGATQNLVLRDDNSVSGSLGKTSSGLGERIFVQHDVNFNVTALTDTSGNVLERWVYTPYGMSTVYTASWSGSGDSYDWVYSFQMGRVEKYIGIKFGARDYDPTLQVWMEADPALYIDGMDRYQLDLSNPISYADPSGLIAIANPGGGYRTYVPTGQSSSGPTVWSPFVARDGAGASGASGAAGKTGSGAGAGDQNDNDCCAAARQNLANAQLIVANATMALVNAQTALANAKSSVGIAVATASGANRAASASASAAATGDAIALGGGLTLVAGVGLANPLGIIGGTAGLYAGMSSAYSNTKAMNSNSTAANAGALAASRASATVRMAWAALTAAQQNLSLANKNLTSAQAALQKCEQEHGEPQ